MKILFLGDFSNLHACLAAELRRCGHEVTVVSDGCGYMGSATDIHVERKPGAVGSFRYLYDLFSVLPRLRGYDVVQFINPNFLSLQPGKIKYFFDKVRSQNGALYLTLCSDDYYFAKACAEGRIFRYSEFRIGDEPTEYYKSAPWKLDGWLARPNKDWNSYMYRHLAGAMAVLPEYDMAARRVLGDKVTFTNLPVELSDLPYSPLRIEGPLRLFIGIRGGKEIQKGTAFMLSVAKELEREMPDKVTVECVRNLSLKEYLGRMKYSHLVLDQYYAYSPATNALQAMALGKVAGTGAQPEYYDYINHHSSCPVFSLSPFEPSLKERLRTLILDPSPLPDMAAEGRKIVERHNDVRIVTQRFLEVWQR